jgi:hypothetical protein
MTIICYQNNRLNSFHSGTNYPRDLVIGYDKTKIIFRKSLFKNETAEHPLSITLQDYIYFAQGNQTYKLPYLYRHVNVIGQ